jgi:hypothetical protein
MSTTHSIQSRAVERRSLSQEIILAVSITIVLLMLLWFAVFRPGAQESGPADLFDSAKGSTSAASPIAH